MSTVNDCEKIWGAILKDNQIHNLFRDSFLPKSVNTLMNSRFVFNNQAEDDSLYAWIMNLIVHFSEMINIFVQKKEKYEQNIYDENYVGALHILDEIESEICISLWSCGQRMILIEKTAGLEEHKKLLSKLTIEAKGNPILGILLEFMSYIAEDNMSYLNYQDNINNYLRTLKSNKYIQDYIDYKSNIEYTPNLDLIFTNLQFDCQLSVVDLYESLVKSIQLNSYDEIDVIELISPLLDIIKDKRLNNLYLLSSENSKKSVEKINIDIEFLNILDQYTIGNYRELVNPLQVYLLEHKNNFQAVLIYLKCVLYSNIKIDEFSPILYHLMYDVYLKQDNMAEAITKIYQYLKMYFSLSWNSKIKGFITSKASVINIERSTHYSYINDYCITPNYIAKVISKENQNVYFDRIITFAPVTCNLFKYICGIEYEFSDCIDLIRFRLFSVESYIKNIDYESALHVLENMRIESNNYSMHIKEKVLSKLFFVYCIKGEYISAAQLAFEVYNENENLIRRYDFESLKNAVTKFGKSEFKQSIYAPLIAYISNKNDLKLQRTAFSNFMGSKNYNTIDDFFNDNNLDCLPEAFVMFLDKICSEHIIQRDVRFASNPVEAEDVRLRVLNKLIDMDRINEKKYFDEIIKITTEKSIRDKIKQINESKISVDIDKIKLDYWEILSENYNKYLAMKEMGIEFESLDILSDEYLNDMKNAFNRVDEKVKSDVRYSQVNIALRKLIYRITEEFLFNTKYGLNSYLSSRIRHGYCKYQLTDLFIEYNLMSKTLSDSSNEFVENQYWDALLPKFYDESDKFRKIISEFTSKIELKVQEVKDTWLKIRFRDDDTGQLDYVNFVYTVSNIYLLMKSNSNRSFDMFFDEIVSSLWEWTEKNLEQLRFKVENELYEYFLSELNQLEEKMNSLNNELIDESIKSFCANVNICKSKIKNKTIEFSSVLHKKDVTYNDFDINDMFSTCFEIINKLNSDFKKVQIEKVIEVKNVFNGDIFPYMVDITSILINNAIIHSGFSDLTDLKINIDFMFESNEKYIDQLKKTYENFTSIYQCNKFVSFRMSNNLTENKNVFEDNKKLKEIIENMNNKEVINKNSQREGGTGLYKICNIIKHNIFAPFGMTFYIENRQFTCEIIMGIDSIVI